MCDTGRFSRWVLAGLLLTATGSAMAAQHHERKRVERAEVAKVQEEWRHAQISEDVSEMDHLLSDDFLGVLASGEVVTKAQQLDRMRTRQLDITTLNISETKIKISGHLAVATSLARLNGTADGKPLTGYFRYTQVYQRAPGDGWKITNFEATRVRDASALGPSSEVPQAGGEGSPAGAPSSPPASPAAPGSPQPQS